MGCIYIIKNTINGKCYVGQTTKSVDRRISNHFSKSSSCLLLSNAIKKYGSDAFTVEILHDGILDIFLDDLEITEIKNRNTLVPNGYNIEKGGHANKKVSNETRKKLSEALKGKKNPMFGKKTSDETKLKISKSTSGKKNHFYGKKHTKETRQKIASRRGEQHHWYGKKHTDETRQKVSEKLSGRTPSPETRKKLSKNNARYWLGKTQSSETLRKRSESLAHPQRATAFDMLDVMPKNTSLAAQRKILRQHFPDIDKSAIYQWVRAYHRFNAPLTD